MVLAGLMAVLLVAPASADANTVQRGPLPEWAKPSALLPVPPDASGPVFISRQDVEVPLDDRGQSQYLGYRVRILNSVALQVGNISIAWNPASGRPVLHGITVYRDGTAIDVLKNTRFDVLRREDQLEAAKLDGTLTAVLRVPDLRVGDELEVEFTTFVRDATLGDKNSGARARPPCCSRC